MSCVLQCVNGTSFGVKASLQALSDLRNCTFARRRMQTLLHASRAWLRCMCACEGDTETLNPLLGVFTALRLQNESLVVGGENLECLWNVTIPSLNGTN